MILKSKLKCFFLKAENNGKAKDQETLNEEIQQ